MDGIEAGDVVRRWQGGCPTPSIRQQRVHDSKRNRRRLLRRLETPMKVCSADMASTAMGLRSEWAAMVERGDGQLGQCS
jgi:hypothetical protein